MDNLIIFNNIEFGNVRAIEIEGKAYAVGIDVAKALGYANPSKAIIDHCKGGFLTWEVIDTLGRPQETRLISESDIYRLIIKAADQSRSPEVKAKAARFEKWVFEEALPSIRKHGVYFTTSAAEELLNNPDTLITLLTTIKEERLEKERLQIKIENDKSKVIFADAVSVSDTTISIADLAKILRGNGIKIGQKRLFERLRNEGFLIRREGTDRNSPSQKSMELGLFRIKETAIARSDGNVSTFKTSKVTGKGQRYFIDYFLSKASKNEVGHDAAN